jgi:hypothetical protein
MCSDRHHPLQKEDAQVAKKFAPMASACKQLALRRATKSTQKQKVSTKKTPTSNRCFSFLTVDFNRFLTADFNTQYPLCQPYMSTKLSAVLC